VERTLRRIDSTTGDVTTLVSLDKLECTSLSARTFSRRLTVWADASTAYVGDSCVHVVYKIALDSGQTTVLAGQLQKIGSMDGPATQALFTFPNIIWGDASFVYVLDNGVHRVAKETGEVTR